MPEAPPPFQPYRADPNAEPKQNLISFLEWISDGIFRIHGLTEANYRYSRATYEMMYKVSHQQVGAPPRGVGSYPPPPRAGKMTVQYDKILYGAAKFAAENRAQFLALLKFFTK